MTPFKVVLIKPSKYGRDGVVERFRRGFMPNSTLLHMKSMLPATLDGRPVEVELVDEYTQTTLRYLNLLTPDTCSLLTLVGVQSHQMHRAIDLAALARSRGVRHVVIGGPHVMTCDTSELHGHGVSFALAEAELIWGSIINDALTGQLQDVYGRGRRWQAQLDPPVLAAPTPAQLKPYLIPMSGIYPARGCPYSCNFCSVVKIAGKVVRSEPVETTLRSLVAARDAGVRLVMFTSDNFNKIAQARALLQAMIEARIGLPFFVQCDVQLVRDEALVALLARAGCAQVFVGVESFSRATLKAARKHQNDPRQYHELVRLCHAHGVSTHFSNIIGFPDQDEQAIASHVAELRAAQPFMASFYILTPIPGTDQYDDFLRENLITECNLDRFDATCAVWRHPHVAGARLEHLLFDAYRQFYSAGDVLGKMLGQHWNAPWFVHVLGLGYAAFARFAARRGTHPMAGGFWRTDLDCAADYAAVRRRVFGIGQMALPASLALPAKVELLRYQNRRDLHPSLLPTIS